MATPKAPKAHKYTTCEVEEYKEIELDYFSENDYERAIEIMKDVASFGSEETIDLEKLIQMAKLKIDLKKHKLINLLSEMLLDIAEWSMENLQGLILPVVIIDRNTGHLPLGVRELVESVVDDDVSIDDFIARERQNLHDMFKGTR